MKEKRSGKHQPPQRITLPPAILSEVASRQQIIAKAYGEQLLILGTFCVSVGAGPFDPSRWDIDLAAGVLIHKQSGPRGGGEMVQIRTADPEKKADESATG